MKDLLASTTTTVPRLVLIQSAIRATMNWTASISFAFIHVIPQITATSHL